MPATGLLGAAIGIHARGRYLTDRSMFGRRAHEHTAWPRRLSGRSRACTSVVGSEVFAPRKPVNRRSRSRRPTRGRRGPAISGCVRVLRARVRTRHGVVQSRQRRHEPARPRVVVGDEPGAKGTACRFWRPDVKLGWSGPPSASRCTRASRRSHR